jgi:NOL1/NOP2/fmu family ribosome biogenesis protein
MLGGVPLGLVLMTYEGVPLGFAKNVGNRLNNLYPNEWRIRKL